jgi:hypothetical protein
VIDLFLCGCSGRLESADSAHFLLGQVNCLRFTSLLKADASFGITSTQSEITVLNLTFSRYWEQEIKGFGSNLGTYGPDR